MLQNPRLHALLVTVQLAAIGASMLLQRQLMLALLAGLSTMALLSVVNTFALVAAHVRHWRRPRLQICVLRIVLMVPVFSAASWVGLMDALIDRWPVACSASGEWRSCGLADGVRECYGAFVIYTFVCYLLRAFGSEAALEAVLSNKSQVEHIWPLVHVLPRWPMGAPFVLRCKRGALQYVVVRLLATACDVLLNLQPSVRSARAGVLVGAVLVPLTNGSQMWAMYALVLFYKAMRKELGPLRPLAKFACIKFVVFLTFWQTLTIEAASRAGWFDGAPYGRDELRAIIKDGLLCAEMYLASLVHPLAFPPADYEGVLGASSRPRAVPDKGGAGGGAGALGMALGLALGGVGRGGGSALHLGAGADEDDEVDGEGANTLGRVLSCGGALHETLLRPKVVPFGELEHAGGVSSVLSPRVLGMVGGARDRDQKAIR